ncbi:hypothetical protein EPN54_05470, partial [bacterium]
FSLLNSGNYLDKSLHALLGKWPQYLGICFIVQDIAYEDGIFKRGIFMFLSGALLALSSGLSQHLFGVEFLRNRSIASTNRGFSAVTSSFAHYNDFGSYLVVVSSFLFILALSPRALKIKTYGFLALAVLSVVLIFLSLSRGAWIALIVSSVLIAVLFGRGSKRFIPLLLVFAVTFLFPIFHERMLFTFKVGGDNDRFRIWLAAWKMIEEHPFLGMGVGTFMANFSEYLPGISISYAHNCYLQIWAETGFFSLASFLVFIVSLVYLGVKKFIATRDLLLLGLVCGTVGFLVHSFFDTNLYSLRLAILFWAWAGLILARMNIHETQ